MWTQLVLLVAGALVALYWISADRAKALARTAAAAACRRAGVQLLDQTVSLSRLRVVRGDTMLAWRRTYRFEYSPDGVNRLASEVRVLGDQAFVADIVPPAPPPPALT